MKGSVVFAEQFRDFLVHTATGHESGLYKGTVSQLAALQQDGSQLAALQQQDGVTAIIQAATLRFFNDTYDEMAKLGAGVAVAPGPAVQFHQMCASIAHSPVCIINIAFRLYLELHLKLDRSLLDVSSYDAYMASVAIALRARLAKMPRLESLFKQHECHGERVCEPLPPGKQMFYLLPENCDKCANCRKPREIVGKLLRCGRCKKVRYCGTSCQRAHLEVHRPNCKVE